MKYLILLVCLTAAAITVTGLGREGREAVWLSVKPFAWPVIASVLMVLVFLLLAHAGGHVRLF